MFSWDNGVGGRIMIHGNRPNSGLGTLSYGCKCLTTSEVEGTMAKCIRALAKLGWKLSFNKDRDAWDTTCKDC